MSETERERERERERGGGGGGGMKQEVYILQVQYVSVCMNALFMCVCATEM